MWMTVLRHGEAGPAARDRLRELTPRGESDVSRGAGRLLAICERRGAPPPDALWYSRWERTRRTAELVAAAVPGLAPAPEEALIPGSGPRDVERVLEPLWPPGEGPAHLVLVSHQPLVSRLVDYLLGQRGEAPSQPPGGLVTLQVEAPAAGAASLAWWAFPPAYEACR